jgi:membrane-associated phospholipid phosphatase
MLVIGALLAAAWRFYPGTRALCLATATLLGIALVATNYHFVSDVIAGAYLGLLVEAVAFTFLIRDPLQPADGNS